MEPQITPLNKARVTPKDFFLHLLAIVTLYSSAISLGTVLFQVINIYFPDPLEASQFYVLSSAKQILRNALSFLIVMFPVYIFTTKHLDNIYEKHAEKRQLRVRKWLIYFTLFTAVIVMMSSIISLINYLLNGELTWRFVLKLTVVLLISASVFAYYRRDVKKYRTDED